jgi:nicotinamidase-related amidase
LRDEPYLNDVGRLCSAAGTNLAKPAKHAAAIFAARLPDYKKASVRRLCRQAAAHWRWRVSNIIIEAEPAALGIDLGRAALVIIDMQRDFLEPGGFGAALGNDVSRLKVAVPPCASVLSAFRQMGALVIHTREGHRPDLTDAPPHKVERGDPSMRIGAPGPMGRILVRGEPGHDIISELYPAVGEPVIDKPGKGAFYQTDLDLMLRNRGIDTLFVCGVTTEVCVNTTVREANDRGYRCIVISDCCASYFPEFHEYGLKMVKAQGGIFGSVTSSKELLAGMTMAKAA